MFHFYIFEILLIFFAIYKHIISRHSLLLSWHVYLPIQIKISHNFVILN